MDLMLGLFGGPPERCSERLHQRRDSACASLQPTCSSREQEIHQTLLRKPTDPDLTKPRGKETAKQKNKQNKNLVCGLRPLEPPPSCLLLTAHLRCPSLPSPPSETRFSPQAQCKHTPLSCWPGAPQYPQPLEHHLAF